MTPNSTFIFLLAVLVGSGSPAEGACDNLAQSWCGKPVVQPASSRIVGGHEAAVGAWPWTVILMETGFALCGGAIINNRFILTAAHCFEDELSRDPKRWEVIAGKYNFKETSRGEVHMHVERIIIHENYNNRTVENDIALLLLRETISYTNFVRPICLPSGNANTALYVGKDCLLAGFGDTRGTAKQHVLNQVTVPVVSDAVCSLPGWYYTLFIPHKTFCAGYEEGRRDACSGDSGGPLISKFDGRWYVSGIASWGHGCAEPRWPGIYTNVTHYLSWIYRQTAAVGFEMICQDVIG